MDEDILRYLSGDIEFSDFIETIDRKVDEAEESVNLPSTSSDSAKKSYEEPSADEWQISLDTLSDADCLSTLPDDLLASNQWDSPLLAFSLCHGNEKNGAAPSVQHTPEMDSVMSLFEKLQKYLPADHLINRKTSHQDQPYKGDVIDARKVFKKSKLLPYHLRVEMGKANMFLAKGELEKAKTICQDVVKQEPRNVQPFHTLSLVYEEQGDEEKALQYSLISAYLECRDASEWYELARRCYTLGNLKQANLCLTKACSYDKNNIAYRWVKGCMSAEAKDYHRALVEFTKLLQIIPETDKEFYLDACKSVVKIYHKFNASKSALGVLRTLLNKYPDMVDLEVVNMMTELLIAKEEYMEGLQLICGYCGVTCAGSASSLLANDTTVMTKDDHVPDDNTHLGIEPRTEAALAKFVEMSSHDNFSFTSSFAEGLLQTQMDGGEYTSCDFPSLGDVANVEDQSKEYVDLDTIDVAQLGTADMTSHAAVTDVWSLPPEMPVDLAAKIAICVIHLKSAHDINTIVSFLVKDGIESVGDLILDIADAYIDTDLENMALPYLQQLVETESYNKAAVWLKLGQCQKACGQTSCVIASYENVISLAPNELRTRSELAKIYSSLGQQDDAIRILTDYVLSADGENSGASAGGSTIQEEDFRLLYQKCVIYYSNNDTGEFGKAGYFLFSNYFTAAELLSESIISRTMMWEIFRKLLAVLVNIGLVDKALALIDSALRCRAFSASKEYRLELHYFSVTVLFIAKRYSDAFDWFRSTVAMESAEVKTKLVLWNLLNGIDSGMGSKSKRCGRYVMRRIAHEPNLLPLIMLNGNSAHMSGTHVYALGEYIRVFQLQPTDPLVCLMMGITFLNMALARYSRKRHSSVLQGVAFIFHYFRLRGKTAEAHYNVARAFHHLGLVHYACHYYNECIRMSSHLEASENGKNRVNACCGLQQEAALNLSCIYRASGNPALAMQLLIQYCRT